MEFLKDHFYKICFDILGKAITFTCKIIDDDGSFILFEDKFGKELSYKKAIIISSEELTNE